jgi:hypothetical protein
MKSVLQVQLLPLDATAPSSARTVAYIYTETIPASPPHLLHERLLPAIALLQRSLDLAVQLLQPVTLRLSAVTLAARGGQRHSQLMHLQQRKAWAPGDVRVVSEAMHCEGVTSACKLVRMLASKNAAMGSKLQLQHS